MLAQPLRLRETTDGVMHETRSTATEPRGAQGLEPPDMNSGIHLTRVRRLAHEGLKAAPRQTEPGEKTQMSPSGPRSVCSEADRVISTFSFNPKSLPNPQNLHRGDASRPPGSVSGMTWASTETRVKEQWNAT